MGRCGTIERRLVLRHHFRGVSDPAGLDFDKIREVRNVWQFYRDRRPDSYDALVAP